MTYSIETQNQLLKVAEPVTGTPFSLHYQSDRTPSQSRRSVTIPLSDATVPRSLERIELQIEIAGQSLIESFSPDPDQQYTFTWNGRDAYGREVQGVREAHVRVGYVYQGVYQQPSDTDRSFAQASGAPIPGSQARQEVTRWREWSVPLGTPWDATAQGLGGWSLDVHHAYDPVNRRFFGGDGSWRNAVDIGETVQIIAGTGLPGDAGDGGPATEAEFSALGVDVTDDGTVYIADTFNHRVRRVATDGTVTTVVGTGDQGRRGDGGPATNARLNFPSDLAVAPDDTLYIADTGSNRVRRVTPDGRIDTVAGLPNPPGDSLIEVEEGTSLGTLLRGVADNLEPFNDVPATTAQLVGPHSVVIGPNGDLYVADAIRVYVVDAAEIITTRTDLLASASSLRDADIDAIIDDVVTVLERTVGDLLGREERRAIRDGLSVVPIDIAVSQAGDLYILGLEGDYADFEILSDIEQATVVLRVGSDGMIERVAGGGELTGGEGDGGSATETRIIGSAVATAPDGTLYIGAGDRVYRADPNGRIFTAAGGNTDLDALVTPAPETDQANPDTREAGLVELLSVFQSGLLATQLPGGALRLVAAPDGTLYFTPTVASYVLRLASAFPSIAPEEIVIAAEDGRELYVFDSDGRHQRTLDALTGADRYAFAYTDAGVLASVTDGDGNVTRIERGGDGTPRAIVSPLGRRTTLRLDADGMLTSVSNPAGEAVQFAYASGGLLAEQTDQKGYATRFEYDEGLLIARIDVAGGRTDFVRTQTENGYEVRKVSPSLRESRYQVERLPDATRRRIDTCCSGLETITEFGINDEVQRTAFSDGLTVERKFVSDPFFGMQAPLPGQTTVTTPNGLTVATTLTRSVEETDGSIESLTDTLTVNGREVLNTYDGGTRTFTTTSPEGRTSTMAVDEQSRVTRLQVAGLAPTDLTYDDRGRLSSIVVGPGDDVRTLTFAYDDRGNLQSVTAPDGYEASIEYDETNQVQVQMLPGGRTIRYDYDINGDLIGLTPPGRPKHGFTYTQRGDLTQYEPPAVHGDESTTYEYDDDGLLMRVDRPDGQAIEIAYDSGKRPTAVTLGRGDIEFTYDPTTGHIQQVTAPDGGTLTYTYDGALPISATWDGSIRGSVEWNYDNELRLAGETVDGHEVRYEYDGDGLLVKAGDLTLARDGETGRITRTSVESVSETWTHTTFGEVASYTATIGESTVYAVKYEYDNLGRIVEKNETVDGETHTLAYGYDAAGRLVHVERDSQSVSIYEYDANGNRRRYTTSEGTTTGSYDDQDRLLTYGDATHTYTANGELRTKTDAAGTITYEYDEIGNLLSVELPDGTIIEYIIDGRNRRVGKKVNGMLVQNLLYTDLLNPVAELDKAGNAVKRFVYGTRTNTPDYVLTSQRVYRIITDQIGSPRIIVDAKNGSIIQRIDYDEFGTVVRDTNPGFQPFGFAGGLYDPDTGLIRFGARDYDSVSGRWLSKDPSGIWPGNFNQYQYADNNPVTMIDTTGQAPAPGYNWCGPGNRTTEDGAALPPTNKLDEACMFHDLEYLMCGVSADDVNLSDPGQGHAPSCQDTADDKLCKVAEEFKLDDNHCIIDQVVRDMAKFLFCDPPLPPSIESPRSGPVPMP